MKMNQLINSNLLPRNKGINHVMARNKFKNSCYSAVSSKMRFEPRTLQRFIYGSW